MRDRNKLFINTIILIMSIPIHLIDFNNKILAYASSVGTIIISFCLVSAAKDYLGTVGLFDRKRKRIEKNDSYWFGTVIGSIFIMIPVFVDIFIKISIT